MLNMIRENRHKLKWVLWPVIIALGASMLFMFVSGPVGGPGDESLGNFIARVDGEEISVNIFRSNLLSLMNMVAPDARRDPQMLRQYGQMTLSQMVRSLMTAQEARRFGFDVSDAELQQVILEAPVFKADGVFIGAKEYKERLRRLGTTPEDYEHGVRQSLLAQKLHELLGAAITVTPAEVETHFRRQHEKAVIRYVTLTPAQYFEQVDASEENLRTWYEANADRYRLEETRQIDYILLDVAQLAERLAATMDEQAVRQAYEERRADNYPDMVRAAHILIKTDSGADEATHAAARARAADLLRQAREGADFADLARTHSQDAGSAAQGGDLDFFPRGRMVAEFEEAAFALEPGQLSEVIQSQFGYHVIKVTGRRDFDHYRDSIARDMARQRAQTQLQATADKAYATARRSGDLQAAAAEVGGEVATSRPFNAAQPDFTVTAGLSSIVDAVFQLEPNQVGEPLTSARGILIPKLTRIIEPHVRPFEEVQASLVADFRMAEADRLAGEAAQLIARQLSEGPDFEAAARRLNLPVETSDEFTLSGSISRGLGAAPQLAGRALRLQPQEIDGPVQVDSRRVVFQVVSRVEADMTQLAAERAQLTTQLLDEKRQRFVEGYLQQITRRYDKENRVVINNALVERILG